MPRMQFLFPNTEEEHNEIEIHTSGFVHYAFTDSLGLIIFITIAAFVYLRVFDFAAKPVAVYFIAYLAVGIALSFVFRKLGTGAWN